MSSTMSHLRRLTCFVAVAAVTLISCREKTAEPVKAAKPAVSPARAAALSIEGPSSVAAGEKVIVKFSRPLAAANERYWITVVSADQPDSQWGAWGYVESAAREAELPVVSTPGTYEVRLHANYPAKPYDVIARASLEIVGAQEPSLSAAADAAASAPAETSPANVSPSDVDAMAQTDFRSPTVDVQQTLQIQRWASDGGGQERIRPSAGHEFLVILFPDARAGSGQIFYDSRQVSLRVGGVNLPVLGPTTGGASAPRASVAPDGTRVFQRGVWAATYAPTPELPFGLAFEIPSDAAQGTLMLGQRSIELSW